MGKSEENAGTSPGLRIALIGTRGVPARYGGFETAVEEIGRRLVRMGHQVTVYGRSSVQESRREMVGEYAGMRTITLPAVQHRTLETLSHSFLSAFHANALNQSDVAIVFNAANAAVLPILKMRRIPVALHADGLEWRRTKWGGAGKQFYRTSESMAVRWADAVIADSTGVRRYYEDEFGLPTRDLSYGAPDLLGLTPGRLGELGLEQRGYHLVVARLEPENNVQLMMEGYLESTATRPLVVVGTNPYPNGYVKRLEELADRSDRVKMVGGIWDQELLDHLYVGALTYLHGHSVGGTNPSLLRAMGAATFTIAHDNPFNRDMLGAAASTEPVLVTRPHEVARALEAAEADPANAESVGRMLHEQAVRRYDWDAVAQGYAALCYDLVTGDSTRGRATGRRDADSGWTQTSDPDAHFAPSERTMRREASWD